MSVNASPAATFQMIPTKLLFRFAKAGFNGPASEGDAQDFSKTNHGGLDRPQFRIRVKMKRVRAGIERWHSSGKDPSAVGRLMEGAQPLANGGKLGELEELVDQALEMLGETEKVPDVYQQE